MESVRSVARDAYFDLATGVFIIIFLIASVCGDKKSRVRYAEVGNGD